jgi:hypothetical protein
MRNASVKPARPSAVRLALLALAGFCAPALAFQPLVTDDTGTQGARGNQLEFSLNADRAEAAGKIERFHSVPVVYTRGLSEALDVYAGLSYARTRSDGDADDASGGGNPSVGAKWRFYEKGATGTSLAFKPEIVFPVSSRSENAGLGTGRTSGSLTLIATQEVPFGAVHINAGVGRDRYRDTSGNPDATTTRASIAPVWDLSSQWKLALDLGTESAHAAGVRVRSNFVELGAIYSHSRDLDFALGIVRASDNDDPVATTHTATAGVTWRYR